MEVLLRNSLQRCRLFFQSVFDILKSSSLQGALLLFENYRGHWQENAVNEWGIPVQYISLLKYARQCAISWAIVAGVVYIST